MLYVIDELARINAANRQTFERRRDTIDHRRPGEDQITDLAKRYNEESFRLLRQALRWYSISISG